MFARSMLKYVNLTKVEIYMQGFKEAQACKIRNNIGRIISIVSNNTLINNNRNNFFQN